MTLQNYTNVKHPKPVQLKERCNDEFYIYEMRTYYYCQLKKGHKGDHISRSVQSWRQK